MDFDSKCIYQYKLLSALKIIRKFDWLLNSYVLDYFVEDHWSKLPRAWQEAFNDMEPSDLGDLMLNGKPKVVLPLSFMALLSTVNYLSIPRHSNIEREFLKEDALKANDKSEFNGAYTCGDHPRLANLFLKHVKKKKRHEICLVSRLVKDVATKEKCLSVIDIGSGLGHLVRTLSYKYNLKCVGVEAQSNLTNGARELDDEFEYSALKYLENKSEVKSIKPNHINLLLTPELEPNIFSETLHKYSGESYGLVGLHPCGDLGPLLLKIFLNNPHVKFICIVGCCYMKLTCEGRFIGYPLSEFVANIKSNHLSYESREIACHAIETYCMRLKKGLYEDLQVHTFRALLEKILVTKWQHMKHMGLRSVKHYNTLTFQKYCEIATERLGIKLSSEDTSNYSVEQDLGKWKKVVIFYTLRLMLAPLVESVILMDRLLSLIEKGATCEITALFDPVVSPRNHILVARKI